MLSDLYNIIQSSETIMLADSGEQSVVTVRFTNAPDGQLLIRKVCSVNQATQNFAIISVPARTGRVRVR